MRSELARLGNSPTSVAQALEATRLKGVCKSPGRCIVAVFLQAIVRRHDQNAKVYVDGRTAHVFSEIGDPTDATFRINPVTGRGFLLELDLPDTIAHFIDMFDDGEYPALVERT